MGALITVPFAFLHRVNCTTVCRGRFAFWAASMLFFFSGVAGLAYEVIWFKRFSHMWGNSSLAVASVAGSFLLGLGLGAHLLGKLADRVEKPFFWYGVFEVAIGIIAIVIPYEITWLWNVASSVYVQLESHPVVHWLARCGLTFLIIGPPCALMGGTLPLLVREFTPPGRLVGEWTGWLYGVNTLGAAVGCYLTGFHLLPSVGLTWSNGVAVALSLNIGIVAMLVAPGLRGSREGEPLREAAPVRSVTERCVTGSLSRRPKVLQCVAAMTGAAALSLQVIWTRQLALLLGGSTYAFSAMLFVLLIGIGLGGLVFHLWVKRLVESPYTLGVVVAGLAVTSLAGKLMLVNLTCFVGANRLLRSSQLFDAVLCAGTSAVLELLPATAMGVLFPLVVHLTRKTGEDAGRVVGNMYAWNTGGSILGATVTAVALIPMWGASKSFAAAMAVYFLAIWLVLPLRNWLIDLGVHLVNAVVGVSVIWLSMQAADPRMTDVGMYLYGYDVDPGGVLYFREGAACNVLVTAENDNVSLRVNGKVDASSHGDMGMQLGLAYFPRFVKLQAREVLVIGFGSGTTSGASLLFPDTRVTCCEIEPAVFSASEFFSTVNHSPEKSADFTVVFDDGRTYVQGTAQRYDLILSEPSNPWMAGVSNLYTLEFYEAAKETLLFDGVLAQWVQVYSLSPQDYAMIVRTVNSVFSHVALIRISDGDTILLASQLPIPWDSKRVRAAQTLVDASPTVRSDLKKYFGRTGVSSLLLRHVILGEDGLRRLLHDDHSHPINSDNNLRLEFDAPLRLYKRDAKGRVDRSILAAADVGWFDDLFRRLGCAKDQASIFGELAELFAEREQKELARQLVELGLRYDPTNGGLLALRLVLAAPVHQTTLDATLAVLPRLPTKDANQVAVALWQTKHYQEAIDAFHGIISSHPQSATAWANLSVNYEGIGQQVMAKKALDTARGLDPFNTFVGGMIQKLDEPDANHEEPSGAQKSVVEVSLGDKTNDRNE